MLLLKLFFSFIQVGLFSVGGGYAAIPLIQEQIVNIHHLMTMEEFSDLITVAEMTPGPISINSSTFVGMRIAGMYHSVICHMLYTRVFLLEIPHCRRSSDGFICPSSCCCRTYNLRRHIYTNARTFPNRYFFCIVKRYSFCRTRYISCGAVFTQKI